MYISSRLFDLISRPFRLPNPRELGWANSNALTWDGDKSWQEYEILMKKDYPVRAFIKYTLIRKVWYPVRRSIIDGLYYIKSHIIPSRRHHKLDLRQPKFRNGKENTDSYSYGWIDSDHQMVLALFNILDNFVKYEFKNFCCPPENDLSAKEQRQAYFEIIAIHNYWIKERNELQLAHDEMLSKWAEAKRNKFGNKQQYWQELDKISSEITNKEDEMILRLIKIRKWLWS